MVHTMLKNTGVSCQTKDTFEYFVFFFFPFLCFFISVLAFQFYTPQRWEFPSGKRESKTIRLVI